MKSQYISLFCHFCSVWYTSSAENLIFSFFLFFQINLFLPPSSLPSCLFFFVFSSSLHSFLSFKFTGKGIFTSFSKHSLLSGVLFYHHHKSLIFLSIFSIIYISKAEPHFMDSHLQLFLFHLNISPLEISIN